MRREVGSLPTFTFSLPLSRSLARCLLPDHSFLHPQQQSSWAPIRTFWDKMAANSGLLSFLEVKFTGVVLWSLRSWLRLAAKTWLCQPEEGSSHRSWRQIDSEAELKFRAPSKALFLA